MMFCYNINIISVHIQPIIDSIDQAKIQVKLLLLNESLADCELQQVNTLSSAKDELIKLGGADSTLLANTIKERYAKLNA